MFLLLSAPENYMDRGTDVRSNCPHLTGDIKVSCYVRDSQLFIAYKSVTQSDVVWSEGTK